MILITGATDGIGLALARHYQSRSERLILLGRRPLDDLDGSLFTADNYRRVDLARPDRASQVQEFLESKAIASIDILIHNAAMGYYGAVRDQSPENIEQMVAVNLMAPMTLTQALMPRLEEAGGKIVLISSVISALPCPRYAVYGATKAALDGFALNLRIELQGSGIRVQVIHPGAVNTGIHAKSGLTREQMDWGKFPSAETVAARIARAIAGRRRSVTIGSVNALVRFAGGQWPGLVDWIARRRFP